MIPVFCTITTIQQLNFCKINQNDSIKSNWVALELWKAESLSITYILTFYFIGVLLKCELEYFTK